MDPIVREEWEEGRERKVRGMWQYIGTPLKRGAAQRMLNLAKIELHSQLCFCFLVTFSPYATPGSDYIVMVPVECGCYVDN